jgi:hypothetical protein
MFKPAIGSQGIDVLNAGTAGRFFGVFYSIGFGWGAKVV